MLNRIKDQNGFTLLEALVAGAILTIGLLGIAGMMISSIHGNAFGGRMSIGENLASQRVEYLKNLGFGSITREIGLDTGMGAAAGGCAFSTSGLSVCGTGTATEDYGQVVCGNISYTKFRRETNLQFLDYTDPNKPVGTTDCLDTNRPKLVTVTVKWKDTTAKEAGGAPKERSITIKGVFAK